MSYDIGRLENAKFEQFTHPEDSSMKLGEYAWIRENKVQYWRANENNMPRVAPYPFARAETVYIIEGSVDIEMPGGETIHLGVGDVGAFNRDTPTVWHFEFPFAKLAIFPEDD